MSKKWICNGCNAEISSAYKPKVCASCGVHKFNLESGDDTSKGLRGWTDIILPDKKGVDEENSKVHEAIARAASKPDPRPINPFDPGTIVSFFDVNNIDHLRAWKWMEESGHWPEYFIELTKDCSTPSMWHACIRSKLADAWIAEKLKNFSEKL